jgi:raffinose synthase
MLIDLTPSLRIRLTGQDTQDIPLRKDGNGWEVQTDQIQGHIHVETQDTGTLLKADLELVPRMPRFGKQDTFDQNQGLVFAFPLDGKDYELMALNQHKAWWTRPDFPSEAQNIPERTQLLLGKANDKNHYFAIMVACSTHYRADMCGIEDALLVQLSSNISTLKRCQAPILAYAEGANPYQLIEALTRLLLPYTGAKLREDKIYPELFEKLGWCSWDAFYHKVDEVGLVNKAQELKDKDIPVRWMLIDDGWSEADYENQELIDLDAAPEKFPGGLKDTVRKVRDIMGQEMNIGVWHASMGYWNGIKAGSPAELKMQDSIVHMTDGRITPSPEIGKGFAFWDRWHAYLKKQDISFAKVDGQSANALFNRGSLSYGESSHNFHHNLEGSAAIHFDGNLINCMGLAPQDVWHRPNALITRSGDDFVPSPDKNNSFMELIKQNAYTSLWLGQLDWCDWDMFWTDHEEAKRNAVLHTVSGGPLYFSDPVGQTDRTYIDALCLSDGDILRAQNPGLPSIDCLTKDPLEEGYMKVFSQNKDGSVIVSAFAFRADQSIPLNIEDFGLEGPYVAYDHYSQKTFDLPASLELESGDCTVITLMPKEQEIFSWGLKKKYNCRKTVLYEVYEKNAYRFSIVEAGPIAVYTEKEPQSVLCNGLEVPFTYQDRLLEIDPAYFEGLGQLVINY